MASDDAEEDDKTRRINGLQPPYHYLQIATWLLFPLLLVHYFAYLMPLLWDHIADQVIVTFLFCLFCVGALYFGYMTCATDPADDAIVSTANTSSGISTACGCFNFSSSHVSTNSDSEGAKIYCYVCELSVDESSKHCRFCNKCVARFDHHCKWLNTCVGRKNYRYFLAVVANVTSLTTISLLLSIAYLVESFAYPDMFDHRVKNAGMKLSSYETGYIAIASVVVLLPLVGLIYQLSIFHMSLVYNNITTYEYIINEQKRLREKDSARAAAAAAKREQKKQLEQQMNNSSAQRSPDVENQQVNYGQTAVNDEHNVENNGIEMTPDEEHTNEEEPFDPAGEYFNEQQKQQALTNNDAEEEGAL